MAGTFVEESSMSGSWVAAILPEPEPKGHGPTSRVSPREGGVWYIKPRASSRADHPRYR